MEENMGQLTLQQLAEHTYFIPAPANIGVYVTNNHAALIDSGNNKDAGRQIFKLLKEQDWTLDLIINTHSNADHIGGNAFLQKKTNCRIAATRLEAPFIQDPVFEPAFLFGGFPIKAMRNKLLMAPASQVTNVIPSAGPILNTGLEAIPLPGHFFDMIGVKTPDDVIFIADTLFPENIIRKYHIFFLYDIQAHFETLNMLQTLRATCYIPGHGNRTTELQSLITVNIEQIEEILSLICSWGQEPITIEELLARVCRHYYIELDANQYVLVTSTLKSYLSYLTEQGRIHVRFSDGKMLWQYAN